MDRMVVTQGSDARTGTGRRRRRPGILALAAAALLGLSACTSADPAADASEPAPATSASSPAASPSPSATDPEAAEDEPTESPSAFVGPRYAELFTPGGLTLEEYAGGNPPGPRYIASESETVVEEKLGTGELQITVEDAAQGDKYRIQLVCPLDAHGKSDIYVSSSPDGPRDWKAGSDGACGDWSAGLPAQSATGPLTVTVVVDNDRPFRVAVTRLNE